MLLNVPFIPETAYVRFLNSIGRHLHSIHFSLEDPALCELLSACDQNCKDCTTCRDLFRRCARPRPLFIKDLRDLKRKDSP